MDDSGAACQENPGLTSPQSLHAARDAGDEVTVGPLGGDLSAHEPKHVQVRRPLQRGHSDSLPADRDLIPLADFSHRHRMRGRVISIEPYAEIHLDFLHRHPLAVYSYLGQLVGSDVKVVWENTVRRGILTWDVMFLIVRRSVRVEWYVR